MIVLPRQARDKHKENSKKRDIFLRYDLPTCMTKYLMLGMSLPDVIAGATSKPAEMLGRGWDERIGSLGVGCAENSKLNAFLEPFLYCKRCFYQDRLGINIARGNTRRKEGGFCCRRGADIAILEVRKRISFAPFYTKNDHFTKTGSGQNRKTALKKR